MPSVWYVTFVRAFIVESNCNIAAMCKEQISAKLGLILRLYLQIKRADCSVLPSSKQNYCPSQYVLWLPKIRHCTVTHREGHEIMLGIWVCMLDETPSVMKTEPMFLLTGDNIAVVNSSSLHLLSDCAQCKEAIFAHRCHKTVTELCCWLNKYSHC